MSVRLEHIPEKALSDFLLGRLDDLEHSRVEAHLDECLECESRAASGSPRDELVELVSGADAVSLSRDAFPVKQPVKKRNDEATHLSSRDSTSVLKSLASVSSKADSVEPSSTAQADRKVDFQLPIELHDHPRYRIIRPLGRGGMGIVWLAQHLIMNRLVAIKVIRSERLKNPDAVERFRREVHAAAKLHHPNVVTAYDADQIGETHFLVVEYIDGETLSELIQLGPLTIAEACSAIRDAACGLAHAHQQGLVHRDVKPGNLIRDRDGTVKVLDFGLVVIPNEDSSITGANMLMGTLDYVAPEQAEDPRDADARSDIYSLGCSLYHLITGSPPFPNMPLMKKLDSHRHSQPLTLSEMLAGRALAGAATTERQVCSKVPTGLQNIVSKMMAKRPDQRYQTAQEIVDVLLPYSEPQKSPLHAKTSPVGSLRMVRRYAVLAGLGSLGALAMFQRHRFYGSTPLLNPMASELPLSEKRIDSESNQDEQVRAKSYPLFVPTAIGDGMREDFSVEENVLTIDSLTRNRQVWLNFKFFESKRLTVRADVRFSKMGRSPVLKFALLSDYGMEYNVQISRIDRRDWLLVKRESRGASETLASYELTTGQMGEWSSLDIRLDNDRWMVYLAGERVIDQVCEIVVDRYPAICVNNCQVELRDPVLVHIE